MGKKSDPTSTRHGTQLTNERKLKQIEDRYPEMEPKKILKKLLGTDVSIDDPIVDGRPSSSDTIGVTGEQGGRLLACYLFKLECAHKDGDDHGGVLTDVNGDAQACLEKAKPIVLLRPAAKLCVEKALKFLPKLKAALAAASTSAARDTDDDADDDLDALF